MPLNGTAASSIERNLFAYLLRFRGSIKTINFKGEGQKTQTREISLLRIPNRMQCVFKCLKMILHSISPPIYLSFDKKKQHVIYCLDHCAMKELGLQYKHERNDYERMARLWTKNFAR
jgi:hypothetical protein